MADCLLALPCFAWMGNFWGIWPCGISIYLWPSDAEAERKLRKLNLDCSRVVMVDLWAVELLEC